MHRFKNWIDLGRWTRRITATATLLAGCLVFATRMLCGAAPQDAAPLQFDVVSVVVDHEGTGGAGDRLPKNGTWRWTRIPLSFLIMYAYDVSLKQIEGIPDSFQGRDPAFDITAKTSPHVTAGDFRIMLQSLLADRFKFAMHREVRDVPLNTIEIAKGGPKLKAATGQCFQPQESAAPTSALPRCGEIVPHVQSNDGVIRWEYVGWSVSVGDLAAALSSNGPLIDDTGIKGLWDIDVTVEYPMQPQTDDPDERSSREFESQRLFNIAFEKQVGLSIDRAKFKKRPIPVIVVDHVELPTPN
jgi:uncharacterized protein (TIGR03435 family)